MSSIKRNSLLLALLWTALLSVLLTVNINEVRDDPLQHAETQAKAVIKSALGFRSWASHFGGVYVQPSEKYPPNPYLDIPDRDVTTTTGKKLTLINPAYMTRQVFQDFYGKDGVNGHLTSLKLLNPMNAPDAWERDALLSFEKGSTHETTIETSQSGEKFFRYMQPLYVEEKCLKCHAAQNYKVGDIRGGISTSINLSGGEAIAAQNIRTIILTYFSVWLIGLIAVFIFFRDSFNWKQNVIKK